MHFSEAIVLRALQGRKKMFNNIKSKPLGILKRSVLLVLFLAIISLTFVSCDNEEKVVVEFELLSVSLKKREISDGLLDVKQNNFSYILIWIAMGKYISNKLPYMLLTIIMKKLKKSLCFLLRNQYMILP